MKYRATHLARLERWLGAEQLLQLHQSSLGVRYPIPVLNIPGKVYAHDGDFYGMIAGGTGFSSLSDLISEATVGGKRQDKMFTKIGTLTAINSFASLWNVGAMPGAGGAPASRPGGAVPTNATVGGLQQADPAGSDTLHITTGFSQGSVAPNTLLLYDRLFHAAAINHNSSAAQTITGVPTRYATTTSPGNFAFLEVTTVLTSTPFNITMTYTDQAGNGAEAAPTLAGSFSSAVTRIPHNPWFIPLNAADTGLRTCTQIQFSAAAASGVSNLVMGHPLAYMPCPQANVMLPLDGINSAFNLVEILTGACLAFIEIKGVGTATTYNGQVIMVSG